MFSMYAAMPHTYTGIKESQMRVLANPGCICPRQDPRDPVINDSVPVEVPDTSYYRRRIADGSLVYAVHAQPAPGKKGGNDNGSKNGKGGDE